MTATRATRWILVTALAASTWALTQAPAGAATTGPCPTADGVTVVVDFQELGGGVHVRCAPGPVSSGFAALQAAGIDYQTTIRFPGFLCRIAGKPANDPCVDASPATAYWSYWLAQRGGTWCYSNWGAGNRTPPPGTVEGWSFSLNKNGSTSPPPGAAPPAAIPGVAPARLAPNDCDQRASAPTAPTTTTTPRTTATTAAPRRPSTAPSTTGATGSDSRGSSSAAPRSSSDPGPHHTAGGAAAPVDPTVPRDDGAATGPEDQPETEVLAAGDTAGDDGEQNGRDGRATDTDQDAEAALVVDLGGSRERGSPIGVVLAAVLVIGLGGGAVGLRRRGRLR